MQISMYVCNKFVLIGNEENIEKNIDGFWQIMMICLKL